MKGIAVWLPRVTIKPTKCAIKDTLISLPIHVWPSVLITLIKLWTIPVSHAVADVEHAMDQCRINVIRVSSTRNSLTTCKQSPVVIGHVQWDISGGITSIYQRMIEALLTLKTFMNIRAHTKQRNGAADWRCCRVQTFLFRLTKHCHFTVDYVVYTVIVQTLPNMVRHVHLSSSE